MQILLAKKQVMLSFILAVTTISFSSLSFSYNPGLNFQPGRDDVNTTAINEAEQGCVYRESDANGAAWTVDDCDYVGAHYACYNGSEWRVAQALGTASNPGEPRDGNANAQVKSVDLWDPVKADNLCKNYFGPSYFFSVPVSAVENEKLGAAITGIIASKKRTWLYYYSNTKNISLNANYWLGNRTEYTNLLNSDLSNTGALGGGVADCTLINRDTGLWQDAPCSEKHSFACYDSGAWLITKTQDRWKSGFSTCENEYGLETLYAVPRDAAENSAIAAAAIPASGSGLPEDYNKVWLNRSDLAFEEFFISNQTRQAWWGAGQPTNRGNADCALIDSSGKWLAESCNGYVAYHACYLGDNSSGEAQWQLTSEIAGLKPSESSMGFGLCKQLSSNAEYRPPNTAVSNNALAVKVDALPDNKFVWINYGDKANEGYWKVESPFLDFVNVGDIQQGDIEDCGYFNLDADNKRNWFAGQCYAGGASLVQGFACSNGYEWKIATQAMLGGASLKSSLWKDGFTACETAFGPDYQFSAPADAEQNSRLALALRLSGNTKAWMNVNDAVSEGEWVSNGPVVNLAPIVTLSAQREFPEKSNINLSVSAIDPETGNDTGLIYQWRIVGERVGLNGSGTDTVITPVLTNANTSAVTISATDLISDDYYLDIQLDVTDADIQKPATTTKVITIRIISPLRAAYDFNNFVDPSIDASGNGHNLTFDVSKVELQAHFTGSTDYFAKLDSTDSFSINGTAPNGLIVGDTSAEYTVMFRFKMDELPVNAFATFLQKGAAGSRQPGIFFNKAGNNINYTSSTTNGQNASSSVSNEEVRLDQWMTVAYVKTPTEMIFYVDKAEPNLDPAPWNTVPDSSRVLNGTSVDYAAGDWHFGNSPFTSEGITGGLDDIRIYDRALTAAELATIFPDQPRGKFQFANVQEMGDESVTSGAANEIAIPVSRIEGDDGEVAVAYTLISGTAILDTDFRLKGDSAAPGPLRGKGTLTWGIHDATNKEIIVELIGDGVREGTETFVIELEQLATEPGLAANHTIDVNITDKTPNPYGAIGMAPTTVIENIAVDEGQAGVVTIERKGDDSLGAFDVTYQVESLTADSTSDFSITQAGFIPSGSSGTNVIIGSGVLSFPNNTSGTPELRQTRTISFNAASDTELEFDEAFNIRLLEVTEPGGAPLVDPNTSAILGTMNEYTQVINDISPGRISFSQASISIDEVKDQVSGRNNEVLVFLERLGGDDGEMCVTLNIDPGSTATPDDYTITYLNPSAAGQADIYWADQDSDMKIVNIKATNDEAYEPAEVIDISWSRKANCNGATSAIPYAPEVTDNASTQVTINDYTTPIKLKFTETNYSVTELTAEKIITVQATQSRLAGDSSEGDFSNANRVNNNGFTVNLTRVEASAIEGVHFGDLSALEAITFAPGETEKTITVPIVDNCVATPSLSVGFGLAVPGSNTLPASLIDVSSASSGLAITNGSHPIGVTNGVAKDFSGIDVRIDPRWKNDGKYYATGNISNDDLMPEFTEMRLKSDITHNCLDNLQFNWTIGVSGTPLPSAPVGFSVLPVPSVTGDPQVLNNFKLPFVLQDTDLVARLEITDPETNVTYTPETNGYGSLANTITVSPYFRIIRNNDESGNNCLDWEGTGSRILSKSCGSLDRQNGIAYHPATQQLVFGMLNAEPECVSNTNGQDDLYARVCSDATAIPWQVTTDRFTSPVRAGQHIRERAPLTSNARPSLGTGGTEGSKTWKWYDAYNSVL